MMYDMALKPPRPGSLKEVLFTMVQMRREAATLLQTRAIIQAARDQSDDGEPTQEAYKDYRLALMPYLIQEEKERSINVQRALAEEFERGPMGVKAIDAEQPGVKSRLRKVAAAARAAEPGADRKRRDRGAVSSVRMAP
jgi:hypothetical protein